jgi:hypothetical protein
VSHRRVRSAPESVVWSARSSRATCKMTSGLSGEVGYRGRSVAISGSVTVTAYDAKENGLIRRSGATFQLLLLIDSRV